jgi:hypothetical protein
VAEQLIASKVTTTPKLGIQGGSNGGLLMGNMLTMRPDLFGAIVCQVRCSSLSSNDIQPVRGHCVPGTVLFPL